MKKRIKYISYVTLAICSATLAVSLTLVLGRDGLVSGVAFACLAGHFFAVASE
jgi:hypothetical protein